MTLQDFNKFKREEVNQQLMSCCGSAKWVSLLMKDFPYESEKLLIEKAATAWYKECNNNDWLEAFSHHPEIGDAKSRSEKFAGKEQDGVTAASKETIEALAEANAAYKRKFNFIFIVCATGKPAEAMLLLLKNRIKNSTGEELNIAISEQHKITLLRLKKILTNANFQFLKMSQLTTHVLDTSAGRPGENIAVKLLQHTNGNWQVTAEGITDSDGRITDLLPPGNILPAGNYKLVFATADYFARQNIKGFYPEVDIQFTVSDDTHYHVPLLISPFGYSTYRGS